MNAGSPGLPRKQRRADPAGRQQCRTNSEGGVAKTSIDDQRAALEDECARLRAECAELDQQLSTAKARIRTLEDTQKDVINRIDWVLDSIHNLVDS